MDEKYLPFIERDPDQADVPNGLTRYIMRDWGTIYYGVLSKVTLNDGAPALEFGNDSRIADGFCGEEKAEYPAEVSRVYLQEGGRIDPAVLRLKVPPPPDTLPAPAWGPIEGLPAGIASLFEDLRRAFLGQGSRKLDIARCEQNIRIAKDILAYVAVEKGAQRGQAVNENLDYLQKNELMPPGMDKLFNEMHHGDVPAAPEAALRREFRLYFILTYMPLFHTHGPQRPPRPRWIMTEG